MKNKNNPLDTFWQLIIRGPESFLKGKTATVVNMTYVVIGGGLLLYFMWKFYIQTS